MSRLSPLALLTFSFVVATTASAQSLEERMRSDRIILFSDNDPAMAKAYAKAETTLDDFLVLAASPPPNTRSFSLKVAVTDGKETEYFWVVPFQKAEQHFVGRIDNRPQLVKNVKEGQEIRFSRSEIVDWMYMDMANRQMKGNFTLCALLTKESASEAERVKRRFNLDCDF